MDLKQAFFASIGWLDKSQERVEEYVEELVERGQLRRKDARQFVKQLMDQAKTERDEFRAVVREILSEAMAGAGVATSDDITDLNTRLDRLEKKIREKKSAGKNAPRAKSSTKRAKKTEK